VALAVGAGLTAVSRMDFAERGMNGTLAWVQTVGMPMRPAMSVMMDAEVDPADAEDAGVDVELQLPSDLVAGRPARVVVQVRDSRTGEPVRDLGRSHEAWMHLIATRSDMGTFAHVHPEPTGRPGELAVTMTFPTAGTYVVNTELRRRGGMSDVHQRQTVVVSGTPPQLGPLQAGPTTRVVDGLRVTLDGDLHVGRRSELRFSFADARTGEPVTDLRPFLAAAGHVVVMRQDGQTFAHEHAEVEDTKGRPVLAMPGTTFGPVLDVHAEFDTPGTYAMWGQFRLATGKVVTVPFTVEVS
jgi:P-type Cu+ transporter